MKYLSIAIALTFPLAAAEPLVTSAAKTKPSGKWEDYPTRLVSSLPDYQATADGPRSTYGGIKSDRRMATGFFHPQQTGRRWWLIDPEGYPFIHVGVVAVAPPGGKDTPDQWGDLTSELLHSNGFNGTGAWSENDRIRASKRPVVYTKMWNFMSHLCLGPRFDFQALQSKPLFEAAGRLLDVIAVNYYHQWSPDPEQVKNRVEWSGKPFIVTEWYAKGMDSGMANTTGAGFVVKTQADRGRFYQNFTLGLLESGGCVGWHWFKYRDNDPNAKGADPSNIDSNKGIVNLALEPYVPLMQAMRELNRQVYSLAAHFDRH